MIQKISNTVLQATFRLEPVGGANVKALLLCMFLTQSNVVFSIFIENALAGFRDDAGFLHLFTVSKLNVERLQFRLSSSCRNSKCEA